VKNALVAVSGGSDSLALLDILKNKNEYNLVVAHVNYNYRDSSTRDENIVRRYCEKNNIKCYVKSLDSKNEKVGNFEEWARVERYKFFKEVYLKEDCVCLFVGHHKDDFIETYLMQKSRNSKVEYYGIKNEVDIQGMLVTRPLLSYSKKDLEEYCKDNNIEYGVDETNYDLSYSRNNIRANIVNEMSEGDKNLLVEKINKLNEKRSEEVSSVKELKKKCLLEKNKLDLNVFNELDIAYKKEILYYFIIDNVYKKISIKESRLLDMIKKIDSSKPNLILAKYDDLIVYKEYDYLYIEKESEEYCYKIDNIDNTNIGGKYIISKTGKKLEKVMATTSEFPLYLRSYDGKNKDVNRIFIDKKIPFRKRKSWPVITNKFGTLLLVINIKKFYNNLDDFSSEIIEFYVNEK